MATPGYELVNGKETGDKLYASEVNRLGDTLDFVSLGFAEWLGSGCLWADGFAVTAIPGSLAVHVSANLAIVGPAGLRVLVSWPGGNLTGLYANATNLLYVLDDGSLVATRDSDPAPEASELFGTATTNSTQATSVSSNPAGRVNLLGAHAARVEAGSLPGYLGDLIEAADASIEVTKDGGRLKLRVPDTAPQTEITVGPVQVTLLLGVAYHIEIDLVDPYTELAVGVFGDTHYDQTLLADQAHVEAHPETTRKAAGRLSFTLQIHADDAEAGAYGGETDLELTAKAKGIGWTGEVTAFDGKWTIHAIQGDGSLVDVSTDVMGVLPVANGGTGASTAAGARANLGIGTAASYNVVPIAAGGTGAQNGADARLNLGLGTMATQNAAGVNVTGGTITGLSTLEAAAQDIYDIGAVAVATEINWARNILVSKSVQKVTLAAASVALSFAGATANRVLILEIVQDGTGGRAVTWPASVKWEGGSAPTLSTAPGAIDVIGLWSDGTNQFGQVFGENFQ